VIIFALTSALADYFPIDTRAEFAGNIQNLKKNPPKAGSWRLWGWLVTTEITVQYKAASGKETGREADAVAKKYQPIYFRKFNDGPATGG